MTAEDLLIIDVRNHLNGRIRGRAARLARLAKAGVPVERAALHRWLEDTLDRRHEADGGLYHACTARVSSGVDPDLPVRRHVGCRVTRVPVRATYCPAGSVLDGERLEKDVVFVCYGNVGVGFMEPVRFTLEELASDFPNDADPAARVAAACRVAEAICRRRLLARGDCFVTRAEAQAAVLAMLDARVGPA